MAASAPHKPASPALRRAQQHELFDLPPMLKRTEAMALISGAVNVCESRLYAMGVGLALNRLGRYLGTRRDRVTGETVACSFRIKASVVRTVIDELRDGSFVPPARESRRAA